MGRIAQNALENAYKGALGAHGLEYLAPFVGATDTTCEFSPVFCEKG